MIGSSPRSWGTRCACDSDGSVLRFIPTLVGNASPRPPPKTGRTVHPHARGERVSPSASQNRPDGSSPRSWGTRFRNFLDFFGLRFIPTLVGNAVGGMGRVGGITVHPHARGERLPRLCRIEFFSGSSPRSWGTHAIPLQNCPFPRFIPTLVGNAPPWQTNSSGVSVHPHARGERLGERMVAYGIFGSSPRSWGTQIINDLKNIPKRFIPTLVGNAVNSVVPIPFNTVHPHARGERWPGRRRETIMNGSSPRSWGTPARRDRPRARLRFIPTLVGNAKGRSPFRRGSSVHPHARGERTLPAWVIIQTDGSSPRSWGTRGADRRGALRRRFIPTLVGNAPASSRRRRRSPVHPHARGERRVVENAVLSVPGSSPRSWGTRQMSIPGSRPGRFIPTLVGNAAR